MALGTIKLSMDGTLALEPQYFFKDRLSIITNLKEVAQHYDEARNFWAIVFILGAIYVGRRAYKYNKQHGIWDKIKAKFQGK